MPTIPDWLIGADTTLLRITPCTKSGTTLTAGSAATYTGEFENFSLSMITETDRVVPGTGTRAHHVPTVDDFEFDLTLINARGANPDKLLTAFVAGRYFYVEASRGGKTFDFYCICDRLNTGHQGQGSQRTGAHYVCVDTGGSDFFTYTTDA